MNLKKYTCNKCGQRLDKKNPSSFWTSHQEISDVYDYLKVWDLEFMPNSQRRFEDFKVWCKNKS